MNANFALALYTEINLTCITDLNVKAKTIKLSKEKHRKITSQPWSRKKFLKRKEQITVDKTFIHGLHRNLKLLLIKTH